MSAPRRPSVLVDWPHESPDSWYHLNYLNFFIVDSWLKLTRAGGQTGRIYSPVTGYAGLSAPFDSTDTCNLIWRLHAADAASESIPML